MQEDFLHYIWQYQKLTTTALKTTHGNRLQVISVGEHNTNSGPDFYNSRILIGTQEWAGTVEIHLKSSDWYVHKHQNDIAYDNVILHVVWENNIEVFDGNQNILETLVLKDVVNKALLQNYRQLLERKSWINCENQINRIDEFTMSFWKQKLLVQRLHRKEMEFQIVLDDFQNNWEALLFHLLGRNFGLKINASDFSQLTRNISFNVFMKETSIILNLEALLFGQSNLLNENEVDEYYHTLKKEYLFLKQKYQLQDSLVSLQFFRLRPASFPTIRLSQFATLYNHQKNLFSKIIAAKTIDDIYELFCISASSYWDTHYTFGRETIKRKKKLSKAFIELLVLNTIIPIKFMYAKSIGKDNFEELLQLYRTLKSENNSVISKFKDLKVTIVSSADTQSLIELKTQYCNQHKCLYCEIGNKLLYPS